MMIAIIYQILEIILFDIKILQDYLLLFLKFKRILKHSKDFHTLFIVLISFNDDLFN